MYVWVYAYVRFSLWKSTVGVALRFICVCIVLLHAYSRDNISFLTRDFFCGCIDRSSIHTFVRLLFTSAAMGFVRNGNVKQAHIFRSMWLNLQWKLNEKRVLRTIAAVSSAKLTVQRTHAGTSRPSIVGTILGAIVRPPTEKITFGLDVSCRNTILAVFSRQ